VKEVFLYQHSITRIVISRWRKSVAKSKQKKLSSNRKRDIGGGRKPKLTIEQETEVVSQVKELRNSSGKFAVTVFRLRLMALMLYNTKVNEVRQENYKQVTLRELLPSTSVTSLYSSSTMLIES